MLNSARITRFALPPARPPDAELDTVRALHPSWHVDTLTELLEPAFPLTSHAWPRCRSVSELTDLARLEVLYHRGGIYLDGDVELWRPLDPLRSSEAFACWETPSAVGSAAMGARAGHPAILSSIGRLLPLIGQGNYPAITEVLTLELAGRPDVLLLPPGSFYPYPWDRPDLAAFDHERGQPWSFGRHLWAASWKDITT